ncbi:golgin subfamily A member 6-like protein 1 [Leptopilina heterotoma]|uniref:golgin subfamily A member 6-like protein 1 n=1 Tax=Leptopilina heterotoma TaxID=63436 RepID=UPI001CA940DD|nr:golgin subfamily A member 6-like protein 1 [Leptopilina heterotoma]
MATAENFQSTQDEIFEHNDDDDDDDDVEKEIIMTQFSYLHDCETKSQSSDEQIFQDCISSPDGECSFSSRLEQEILDTEEMTQKLLRNLESLKNAELNAEKISPTNSDDDYLPLINEAKQRDDYCQFLRLWDAESGSQTEEIEEIILNDDDRRFSTKFPKANLRDELEEFLNRREKNEEEFTEYDLNNYDAYDFEAIEYFPKKEENLPKLKNEDFEDFEQFSESEENSTNLRKMDKFEVFEFFSKGEKNLSKLKKTDFEGFEYFSKQDKNLTKLEKAETFFCPELEKNLMKFEKADNFEAFHYFPEKRENLSKSKNENFEAFQYFSKQDENSMKFEKANNFEAFEYFPEIKENSSKLKKTNNFEALEYFPEIKENSPKLEKADDFLAFFPKRDENSQKSEKAEDFDVFLPKREENSPKLTKTEENSPTEENKCLGELIESERRTRKLMREVDEMKRALDGQKKINDRLKFLLDEKREDFVDKYLEDFTRMENENWKFLSRQEVKIIDENEFLQMENAFEENEKIRKNFLDEKAGKFSLSVLDEKSWMEKMQFSEEGDEDFEMDLDFFLSKENEEEEEEVFLSEFLNKEFFDKGGKLFSSVGEERKIYLEEEKVENEEKVEKVENDEKRKIGKNHGNK